MENSASQIHSSRLVETTENFFVAGSFQNLPSVLLDDLSRLNAENARVLEHLDIAVYAVLKSHARLKGECHPSLERIAKLSACSVSTVQRSLKRLDDAGHIQRKSHIKGKIFLLTDVTAKGEVLRKNRICFAAAPRNPRFLIPPKVQDMASVTSSQDCGGGSELTPDGDPPF